jgi:hypothetical protein
VEVAIREWSRMQDIDFYRDCSFKLVPRWEMCVNVLGIMVKNNDASVEEISALQVVFMAHGALVPEHFCTYLFMYLFIYYGSCNEAVSSPDCRRMMNNELERVEVYGRGLD